MEIYYLMLPLLFTTESLPLKAEMLKLENARVKSKSSDEYI